MTIVASFGQIRGYQMYYQVASTFVMSGSTPLYAYSQVVNLAGANAAYVTVQTIAANLGAGVSGSAILQIGNDLENWSDVTSPVATISSVGAAAFQPTALAAQYARLRFLLYHASSGSGTLILAADINTAAL